jgi:hypothetical protein
LRAVDAVWRAFAKGGAVLSRLVALVVAVGLVAGALALRERVEGRVATAAGGGVLHCIEELRAVCAELAAGDDLDVRIGDAGAQLEQLAGPVGDAEPAAWLTVAPFPQMLADRRAQAGLDAAQPRDGAPLARSPLVLAVWEERQAVLRERCPEEHLDWACVGELAGTSWSAAGGPETWGDVKPGYADAAASAEGLLVVAQASSARLAGPVSVRAFDDTGFFTWFAGLQRAVPDFSPPSGSPLLAMAQIGPAAYDVVGTTEAAALAVRRRSEERTRGLTLVAGEPLMSADVVVTALNEAGAAVDRDIRERAPQLLAAQGWRVAGDVPAGGLDDLTLPEDSGAPPAGTLEALRTRWSEVTR